jgi:hypothetical protein
MSVEKVSGLEVDQDLAFQRRWWRIQRVARGLLFVALGVAASGLLGHGPLAAATHGQEGSALWLDYQRFIRHSTLTELTFHVLPGQDGELALWIGDELLERTRVQRITPEPDSRAVASDRILYRFKVAEPGRPLDVRFSVEPAGYGPLTIRAGVPQGPELSVGTFVFP